MIDQVAAMGTPILVLSGGDALNRPDLFELVRHAKSTGLRTATIPAATDALDESVVLRLKDAGLDQMALSLEFPDAARHDDFRGVPGAFDKTIRAAGWARAAGLPLQINTTVCGDTARDVPRMAELVDVLGAVFWEVFFLIPMGRGLNLSPLSAPQCESIFGALYEAQKKGRFIVKVTEAPHYRRHVFLQERDRDHHAWPPDQRHVKMPARLTQSEGPGHTIGLAPRGVNAGKGFMFVSHTGDIYPSGFLPLRAGNVREQGLADTYRENVFFRSLRDTTRLKGRCGRCEFNEICGGSRARAFALTGDPLQTDPWCVYEPHTAAVAAAH
jgi:radical SAM protein with 4Fe4S-binding SPASM domain